MAFRCFQCHVEASSISMLVAHLRRQHKLDEGKNLKLTCCNCSSVLHTYSGFRNHLSRCNKVPDQPDDQSTHQINDVNESASTSDQSTHQICDVNSSVCTSNQCTHQVNDGDQTAFISSHDSNIDLESIDRVHTKVTKFISFLYGTLKLPEMTINSIFGETKDLVFSVVHEATNVMKHTGYCETVINDYQQVFDKQNSTYKRKKLFGREMVKPEKMYYGSRIDSVYDPDLKRHVQKPVVCTFSYVSLLENLKFLLQNETILEYVCMKKTSSSDSYSDFTDGEIYKTHPFFKDNEISIRLIIYYDEFEVVNDKGSKVGVHKQGAFYFIIDNLPAHLNSSLKNIHLLALVYNEDIQQFGINPVLNVIVRDLLILETTGIYCDKLETHIKGTLIGLSHDNLGGAILLCMIQSFNADYYCRICLMRKKDAQESVSEDPELIRKRDDFKKHVEELKSNHKDGKLNALHICGIKDETSFVNLTIYDIARNFTVDVMHDLLEGIVQRDIKLLAKYLVRIKIASLEDINELIRVFGYGLNNMANKPGPIKLTTSTDKIRQSAAQTLCLLKFLPLILNDCVKKIPEEDIDKWNAILVLISIVKTACAPKISKSSVERLEKEIILHHTLIKTAYNISFTPKDHFITHYPSLIKLMGPLRRYWTMRFESLNGWMKQFAKIMQNYNDLSHTLAERHQQAEFCEWRDISFEVDPDLKKPKLQALKDFYYGPFISEKLDVPSSTIIECAEAVLFYNNVLRIEQYICTSVTNNLPDFAKIIFFFSLDSVIYVILKSCKTVGICKKSVGYTIIEDSNICIQEVCKLSYSNSYDMHCIDNSFCMITDYFIE